MRRLLPAALLLLAGCVAHRPAPAIPVSPAAAPVLVEVIRDGARWTADFHLPRAASVWMFARSALARAGERPWRPQSFTVETPGVRLERRGHHDVLIATGGGAVPRRVRIRFIPFADDLLASYDPALAFSDGAVALHADQFHLFPYASPEAVAGLPLDLNGVPGTDGAIRLRFRDAAGPVLHAGERRRVAELADGDAYVLFGRTAPVATAAMTAIFDPALPDWLGQELRRFTPDVLAALARELGPPPGPRPTIMVSWAGPTPRLQSFGGSVLPGTVVMRLEGEGVIDATPEVRNAVRWFIAHESAHFWLGQTVRYERARDAWITEGGADLLAVRAVAAADPGYNAKAELQREVDDCARLAVNPVASANERNEHRAYYACGAVFGLAAEAATGQPFAAFTRRLLDANRADGILTRAEWLAPVAATRDGVAIVRLIEAMLDRGVADPKAAIAELFTRAGVRHGRAADGTPRLE